MQFILRHIQFINNVSDVYHQVTILAYKVLIKNICIINTPYAVLKIKKLFALVS